MERLEIAKKPECDWLVYMDRCSSFSHSKMKKITKMKIGPFWIMKGLTGKAALQWIKLSRLTILAFLVLPD